MAKDFLRGHQCLISEFGIKKNFSLLPSRNPDKDESPSTSRLFIPSSGLYGFFSPPYLFSRNPKIKKSPNLLIRGFPFFIPRYGPVATQGPLTNSSQAGFLIPGLPYSPRLPIPLQRNSGLMRFSSPVTAAGPPPFFTEFPFTPFGT